MLRCSPRRGAGKACSFALRCEEHMLWKRRKSGRGVRERSWKNGRSEQQIRLIHGAPYCKQAALTGTLFATRCPKQHVGSTFFAIYKGAPRAGYLKAVWPDFFGSVFGVWTAPGGFKTIQKFGGLRPPHFWMVLKPSGAAQTPKTDPKNPARLPSGTQLPPSGP